MNPDELTRQNLTNQLKLWEARRGYQRMLNAEFDSDLPRCLRPHPALDANNHEITAICSRVTNHEGTHHRDSRLDDECPVPEGVKALIRERQERTA